MDGKVLNEQVTNQLANLVVEEITPVIPKFLIRWRIVKPKKIALKLIDGICRILDKKIPDESDKKINDAVKILLK